MDKREMVFKGAIITLVSITKNKIYECSNDCYKLKRCEEKLDFMAKPNHKNLCVTEIIVDILNPTDKVWEVWGHYWKLVDCNAYTYSYATLCYHLRTNRMIIGDELKVIPYTKARVYLWFPQLDDQIEISSIIISHNDDVSKISIAPLTEDIRQAINNSISENEISTPAQISFDVDKHKFKYLFQRLERDCHSRTHNVLIPREITKLENSIKDTLFALNQHIETLSEQLANAYKEQISSLIEKYEKDLKYIKTEEEEKSKLNSKIDDLYSLTDREFEEWTADLFESLGFQVTLTPKSNDKGIDVICRRDGKLTVVQCKKYKGVVGSPDIQKFLGAIENAKADEGYFLTTGTFSVGAEKSAKNTKIVLCDKLKIRELVEIALEC